MHRPATPARIPITVQKDHVDIQRAQGNAFFHHARGLVYHRRHIAVDDLLIRNRPAIDFFSGAFCDNDFIHLRIRCGFPIFVDVKTPGRFASKPTHLAQAIRELGIGLTRITRGGQAFARCPADVEPGQIPNGKGPHGQAKIHQGAIDIEGAGAGHHRAIKRLAVIGQDPITDKPVANT